MHGVKKKKKKQKQKKKTHHKNSHAPMRKIENEQMGGNCEVSSGSRDSSFKKISLKPRVVTDVLI